MLNWSVAVLFYLSLGFCRLCSVLNSGVLLLLCKLNWPFHLGIDNLNVVRSNGRLLDADCLAKPLPLVKDGDLVALVQHMIRTRGRHNTLQLFPVPEVVVCFCMLNDGISCYDEICADNYNFSGSS